MIVLWDVNKAVSGSACFCTLCAKVLQSGCKTALPRILTTCLTFSAMNSVGSSSSLTPWWYLQLPYDATWARNIIQSFNRVITWGRHASGSPQSQQPPPVLFAYQSCPVWSLFLKHSSQIAQLSSICARINIYSLHRNVTILRTEHSRQW